MDYVPGLRCYKLGRLIAGGEFFGHPNAVQVFDYGHAEDGTFYYAMEYLPGLNLQQFLAAGPAQEFRNQLGTRMYTACARMYEAHMNYADPHPGNVMVTDDGKLALLDLGMVARVAPEMTEHTTRCDASHACASSPTVCPWSPANVVSADHRDAHRRRRVGNRQRPMGSDFDEIEI